MVKKGNWTTDEDEIAENWDNDPAFASRPLLYNKHTKTASVRLLDLSLLLDRSPSGTYQRILKLRKSPAERMRLAQIHKDSNARGNPIHNANWNPITNPINAAKRHEADMTGKVAFATLLGHSPPSEAWHAANVTKKLASEEAQAALKVPGVVIHCFAHSRFGLKVENAGHCTTNHHYLNSSTGNPIKLGEYNAQVFLIVELGMWDEEVSWINAEGAATNALIDHPGCINSRTGGAGGNEATCGGAIEFLFPIVRTLWRPNFKPVGAMVGKPW
jgi:hypothetical protein